MLKTFSDIQSNQRIVEVSNSTPNSPEFVSLVNSAVEQLMNRGNWWGTVQPIQGCVYGGYVVWPRTVASVLAMNVANHPTQPANRWYQFMQWEDRFSGWGLEYRGRGLNGRSVTDSDGTVPTFNSIPCGTDMIVQFNIDNALDAGKTIRIYGIDTNGQALQGQRSDGTWQDGMVLTFAIPSVQTPIQIRRIDRVVKDVTNGRVRGYMVDANGVLYDMALYHPQETSPDYVRTRIPGCKCFGQIEALVKLAFVPVVNADDLVQIECVAAIRDMILSIKKKEAGDITGFVTMEKSAFRELNYEMRTRFPDEQFVVNFRPFGNNRPVVSII